MLIGLAVWITSDPRVDMLSFNLIIWSARKQSTVSISSTESEYKSLANGRQLGTVFIARTWRYSNPASSVMV
jgi:hypothetical protein